MRGIVGMLPWLVVLAIAGAAIWLLLERQAVLGAWVLAALLLGHGLVHVLYLVPTPGAADGSPGPRWPFDLQRSWLVALAGARRGRRLAAVLIVGIVGLSILAALATVGIVAAAAWPALVAAAAAASLVLLVLAFDVQLVLGIGIDVVFIAVALTGAWAPQA
jgi:hypothetical protein